MKKLKEEFFKILPPTIYFFVALHIVAFVRVLMLEKTGVAPSSSISIAVAALILGKAVLIADMLPLINRFPNKPPIYNIAWKTVIYLLLSAVIHYLERLYDFWRETGSFVAGNQKLLSEIIWPHFWAEQTQNQGGQRGNHAGNHLHGVLGSIAQMMFRQQAMQQQTKQSPAENAPGAN